MRGTRRDICSTIRSVVSVGTRKMKVELIVMVRTLVALVPVPTLPDAIVMTGAASCRENSAEIWSVKT